MPIGLSRLGCSSAAHASMPEQRYVGKAALGGASILGAGSYLGTVAGVILITLLQSILSVIQMPDTGRQVIYSTGVKACAVVGPSGFNTYLFARR